MFSNMKQPRGMTGIIHLAFLSLVSADTDIQSTYYMQKYKGFPQATLPEEILQTDTVLDCARLCGSSSNCYAFHAEKQTNNWTCRLYWDRFKKNEIPSGDGLFGVYFGYVEEASNILEIGGAEFLFYTFDLSSGNVVALYDCSKINSYMTTVGIRFDHDNDEWPSLSWECQESLCHQLGLAATVLKIREGQDDSNMTMYIASTTCPSSDEWWDNAECDHLGQWTFQSYDLGVACISSSCSRYNSKGKAVYGGSLNISDKGIPCEEWTLHSEDYFPEDYSVIADASNFCRDPDYHGTPWCFQSSGNSWEECDVMPCYWPFDI